MQVGGFVLPLLVFGGISLILTLLLLINVHPTGTYIEIANIVRLAAMKLAAV